MTWVKLDDGFADHPKVVGLSPGAFRLYVTALCYSARHNTDGRVAKTVLAALRGSRRDARALERASLWEPVPGGWLIHDYLEYNRSASDVANARTGARDRMQGLRATRGARRLLPPPSPGALTDPPEPVRLNEARSS